MNYSHSSKSHIITVVVKRATKACTNSTALFAHPPRSLYKVPDVQCVYLLYNTFPLFLRKITYY